MNFLVIFTFVVAVLGLWFCEPVQGATRKDKSVALRMKPCRQDSGFFKVLDENSKIVYVTCFDLTKLTPHYTVHKLLKSNDSQEVLRSKGFYAEQQIFKKVDINSYYKGHEWKFMEYFHAKYNFCAYKYFSGSNNYLARGHLVPDADFSTRQEKQATFNYINTAPQFQNVNQGDWFRVENYVRKMAEYFNTALRTPKSLDAFINDQKRNEAWTGYKKHRTEGSLKDYKLKSQGAHSKKAAQCLLKKLGKSIFEKSPDIQKPVTVVTGVLGNTRIQNEDLYLADKRIPVPYLFWKAVIYHPDCDDVNLIFLRTNYYYDKLESICLNICEDIGFLRSEDQPDDDEAEDEITTTDSTICCNLISFNEKVDGSFKADIKLYRKQIRENLKSAMNISNTWENL